MRKSDLPFGSEFSPSQVSLPDVLDLAKAHGGDWKGFEAAVRARYFEHHATSDYNRGKLANNCKLGMIAYAIIDRDARLTNFGNELWSLRNEPPALYAALGRHILLSLHGLAQVQTVLDMQARGESVSLNSLREWLEERGVHFPRGGKHPSIMRLWLEKAGVFIGGSWRVDENRLRELVGADLDEIDLLAGLSAQQKAYLRTLANLGDEGPHLSNEIEKVATATYGVKFDEKNLPKSVLYPLREAGYVTLERGTKVAGRGAKPFFVTPTARLKADVVAPLLNALDAQVVPELRPLLRKSLAEILSQVESPDKHARGLALEALAFYLMRLIDLKYVGTRLRGEATGGAEVDLVFEGSRLLFSRWQIQCKNTAVLMEDDVAREVGLLAYFRSDVAVLVSTGAVDSKAVRFAEAARRSIRQPIVLVDGETLGHVSKERTAFLCAIRAQGPHALTLANSPA